MGSATAANRLDIQKKTRTRGRRNPLLHLLGNWFLFFLYIKAFKQLNKVGHYRLVVKYWKEHRKEVEGDVNTWSETGRALASLKCKNETRILLSSWRQRQGVGMWVVANYVGSLSRLKPSELREIAASCTDALRDLPP
jgi:hypothetical protein